VAVAAGQEGIDPVGCCVGLRGIRIQSIVNEVNGEKIDVVMWSSEVRKFIANALSPAQILDVGLNEEEGVATVVVPDKQLSLAIGKEGQNARLSAKLTGWRIDIKSASVFEVEKEEAAKVAVETEKAAVAEEEPSVEVPAGLEPEIVTAEAEEPVPVLEAAEVAPAVPFEPQVTEEKAELRFAEDIAVAGPPKSEPRSKKKKKKGAQVRDRDDDGVRLKRVRRHEVLLDEADEYQAEESTEAEVSLEDEDEDEL